VVVWDCSIEEGLGDIWGGTRKRSRERCGEEILRGLYIAIENLLAVHKRYDLREMSVKGYMV